MDNQYYASQVHLSRHISDGVRRQTGGGQQNQSGSNGSEYVFLLIFFILRPFYRIYAKQVKRKWPQFFLYPRYGDKLTLVSFILLLIIISNIPRWIHLITQQ